MDVFEAIITRRSIRKYKDAPVPVEMIGMVCEAGRQAPSAGNLHPFRIVIVTHEDQRKLIAEACLKQYWMQEAPVHLVICAEPWKSEQFYGKRGEDLYTKQSCAACAQNMLLTAHSLGLGACWVSAFDESMIQNIIEIKGEYIPNTIPQVIVTLGYANEVPPVPMNYRFDNQVYLHTWWNRINNMDLFLGYTGKYTKKAIAKTKQFLKKATEKLQGTKENKEDHQNKN